MSGEEWLAFGLASVAMGVVGLCFWLGIQNLKTHPETRAGQPEGSSRVPYPRDGAFGRALPPWVGRAVAAARHHLGIGKGTE